MSEALFSLPLKVLKIELSFWLPRNTWSKTASSCLTKCSFLRISRLPQVYLANCKRHDKPKWKSRRGQLNGAAEEKPVGLAARQLSISQKGRQAGSVRWPAATGADSWNVKLSHQRTRHVSPAYCSSALQTPALSAGAARLITELSLNMWSGSCRRKFDAAFKYLKQCDFNASRSCSCFANLKLQCATLGIKAAAALISLLTTTDGSEQQYKVVRGELNTHQIWVRKKKPQQVIMTFSQQNPLCPLSHSISSVASWLTKD